SHAYIFSGPQGIGKKTIARIFAGLLLCSDPRDGATCGRCKACLLMENGTNPDFVSINTDGPGIGVDLVRGIQADSVLRPMYSRHKVYIVKDAAKMTVQAELPAQDIRGAAGICRRHPADHELRKPAGDGPFTGAAPAVQEIYP